MQRALKRDGESGILGLPAHISITAVANKLDLEGVTSPLSIPPQTDATDLLCLAFLSTCVVLALLTFVQA